MKSVNEVLKSNEIKHLVLPFDEDIVAKKAILYPPKFERGRFNLFIAKYIVHKLYSTMRKDKSSIEYGYSPMNAKYIEKEVYNYREYIKWLIVADILDKNFHSSLIKHSFKPGCYPKSYRFNKKNLEDKPSFYIIAQEDKLKSDKIANRKLPVKFVENNIHLFSSFNNYLKFIENIEFKNLLENFNKSQKKNVSSIINNKYNYQSFSVDKFGNRFYSPITNLKKSIRNFLTYDNEQLVELDIKNCQPYLLNIILNNLIDKVNVEHKNNKIETNLFNKYNNFKINELDNYLKISSNGKIYEEIVDFLLSNYSNDEIYDMNTFDNKKEYFRKLSEIFEIKNSDDKKEKIRDVAKLFNSKYLFGDLDKKNPINEYYETQFPDIHSFLINVKNDETNNLKRKLISKVLQKIESKIVLENISKEFYEENKNEGAIVLTIHDCMITQKRFIERLNLKAKEVFLRYLPMTPNFHKKPFFEPEIKLNKAI